MRCLSQKKKKIKSANVPRPVVYYIILNARKMGFYKKNIRHIKAEKENLRHIETLLQQKKQELDSLTEISAGGAVVGKYDRTVL